MNKHRRAFEEITHPDASKRIWQRYSVVWIDLRVAMVRDKQGRALYMIGQIDKTTPPEALPQKVYPYDYSDLLFRWPSQMMPLLAPA